MKKKNNEMESLKRTRVITNLRKQQLELLVILLPPGAEKRLALMQLILALLHFLWLPYPGLKDTTLSPTEMFILTQQQSLGRLMSALQLKLYIHLFIWISHLEVKRGWITNQVENPGLENSEMTTPRAVTFLISMARPYSSTERCWLKVLNDWP